MTIDELVKALQAFQAEGFGHFYVCVENEQGMGAVTDIILDTESDELNLTSDPAKEEAIFG